MTENTSPAEDREQEGLWNRVSVGVISGVISGSIVLIFIRPILGFLWRFLLSNVQSIVNKACAQAALGYTDIYNFWFSATATVAYYTVAIATIVGYLVAGRRKTTQAQGTFPSWRIKTLLVASLSVGAVLGTVRLSQDFVVMQLKASFYQRLTVLAPRISEQRYKEYLASWAGMRNEDDYRRIVESMEADANKNGVALPDLLSGARISH